MEVRSKAEILATLDEQGRLDNLPFMPEMFQYCGKRLQVWKRAHKTCDTVNRTGGRRMTATVHLQELRCDGQSHGGCDAACLLFWKEAWLKPVAGPDVSVSTREESGVRGNGAARSTCTEQQVISATRADGGTGDANPIYSCQATLLPDFTSPLKWWDIRQYFEDYTSGNVSLRQLLGGAVYASYYALLKRTERFAPVLTWRLIRLYDLVQRFTGGIPYPRLRGTVKASEKTPSRPLNLQAGETVRVLPYRQVLETLDARNKNRGMYFDAEEVPFCEKTFQVRSQVRRIINERTGEMIPLQGQNVILEHAWCQARYSDRRMMCPRAIYPIWRETWLERVHEPTSDVVGTHPPSQPR